MAGSSPCQTQTVRGEQLKRPGSGGGRTLHLLCILRIHLLYGRHISSSLFFFFLWLVQIFLSSHLRNLVADCTAEEDFDSFANIFCPSFGEVQRTACLGLQTFPLLKSATLLTQTCHQKQAFISIICSIILKILVVAVNVFSPGISKSNYFLLYD